uniref:Uncharacterized protein n=1 Tax=Candidatus Kentrum sp. LPFa TaxID=2126335 RepID=A0A450XF37_9GAMM|nr:MAG: hypothetical protein BECKLPF1236A_GA0070988_100621 [Candidatus Kentron sp. LPFa]VFK27849.1 MAG: hypothetical protein BECKLPF1236C_GA0070990_100543 [Candidatus Kentron sp. LPFa]
MALDPVPASAGMNLGFTKHEFHFTNALRRDHALSGSFASHVPRYTNR